MQYCTGNETKTVFSWGRFLCREISVLSNKNNLHNLRDFEKFPISDVYMSYAKLAVLFNECSKHSKRKKIVIARISVKDSC